MGGTASKVGPRTALDSGAGTSDTGSAVRQGRRPGVVPGTVTTNRKEVYPVKFARTIGGLAAVVSVIIMMAAGCEQLAAMLDAAIAI